MPDTYALLSESLRLKMEIADLQLRLREVNADIAALAVFPEGRATATLSDGDLRAKVVNKTTLKWDQQKLNAARAALGDDAFLGVFTFEWKPKCKKALDGFLQFAPRERAAPITDALTILTTSSVTVEKAA